MPNCLCEAKFCRQKNEWEKKQIRRAFSKRNPSQKQRKRHIVQNENIQRYVSVKVPVKSCKISNISKYEHWDFTPLWRLRNNNNFYLNVTEPKSAQIFTSEILKMNPTLRYFVSSTLKLASNQLHASSSNWCQGSHNKLKGTMIRVLVENNFDCDNVCHMAIKVFRSTFTTAMCKCTIITLLDDSNLNAFQNFWPRLNILRLVDVPKIIADCNFHSAVSRVSLSKFSFY